MRKSLKEIVAINLKYLRYKSGKSQEEFYSEASLNVKYLACIERGSVNFKANYLDKICNKLKINLEDLTTFSDTKIVNKKRIDEKEKVNS